MKKTVLVPLALVTLALVSVRAAQNAPPAADSPAFEVASVKLNKTGDFAQFFRTQPGQFTITNVPARQIIQFAYQLQPFQIVGGPDWLLKDRFDVVAKTPANTPPLGPPGANPGPSPMALMVQNLLAERFKLRVHRDTREMPIYALVLARPGGKLGTNIERPTVDCAAVRGRGPGPGGAPAGPPAPPKPGERPPCGMFMGPGNIAAGSVTMAQFANSLAARVGRPVIDKTGLDGLWAFDLSFAAELPPGAQLPPGVQLPPTDPNAPTLFTALQEQLGVKLDATKGPVDVVVIDSVDHPTED